jgi:hypothetical protein
MFFLFYTLFAWPLIFCEGGGVTEWLRSTPWWVHPMAPSALSCLLFSVLHIRWTFPFLSFPVILVIWISPSLFIMLYGLFHLCSSFLGFSSQGCSLLSHHPIYIMLVCNKRQSIRRSSSSIFRVSHLRDSHPFTKRIKDKNLYPK